jgi:hypothetical protein
MVSESEQAYVAFTYYRDLPASDRSIERAFEVFCHSTNKEYKGKAYGSWKRWCSIHQWVERSRAYDAEAQRQARSQAQEERRGEIKRWLDEQFTISKAFQTYVRREIRVELETPGTHATHQMRQLALVFDIAGNWVKEILGVEEKDES